MYNSNNDGGRGGRGRGARRSNRGSDRGSGRGSGRRGGGRHDGGHENIDRRQGEASRNNRISVHEIKSLQQETTIANFSSSELTYNGSDRLVFITNGDPIKTIWKKMLRKENSLNQNDIRIFIASALVATDNQSGYEAEELITELGNPEGGLKRLRDIMNFPSMSCDAGLDSEVLSFQHVILPLLGLLTRTAVSVCIMEKYVHAIYMAAYTSLDSFLYHNVMTMLETLVERNSVVDNQVSVERLLSRDRYLFIPSSLGIFFLIIVRLLTELLRRIKEASINETMHRIARDLQRLRTTYQQSFELQEHSFASTDPLINNLETRKYFFMILEKEMKTMNKMLNNGRNNLIFEQSPNTNELNSKSTRSRYKELARKVDAERSYDPPGELSKNGKRHDNDFIDISEISIIPTREEILCERLPFLPSSLPDAPHFLPDGAARLLDTQFRLLREDLLSPVRGGLQGLLTALSQERSSSNNSKLSKDLKKVQNEGGRFAYDNNGDVQVYPNARFVSIACDRRKGFACTIGFTPPKIRSAKNERERKDFWGKCKRLLNGSLVALLLPNPDPRQERLFNFASRDSTSMNNFDMYSLYFGIVLSRDEKALARYEDHAEIDVGFIDPSIFPIALNEISNQEKSQSLEKGFMVESTGVYLEAYYHILKTLQTTNPSSLPFEKYLAPNSDDLNKNKNENNKVIGSLFNNIVNLILNKNEDDTSSDMKVEIPLYTRAPGFQFDLSVLCQDKYNLKLYVADTNTYDAVAKNINRYSIISKPGKPRYGLDETQAKALISALTREIALIEGPPGTGKTVVGVQIMKVLLAKANRKTNIGPILTICFTNHALDQFLEHLLEENITKIVRLGSRTKSEKIKEFGLEEVCRNRSRTKKESYLIAKLHESLEAIEKEANELKDILFRRCMKWSDIQDYLMKEETYFYYKFMYVSDDDLPSWVLGTDDDESWTDARNKRKKKIRPFDEWINGRDIMAINKRKQFLLNPRKEDKKNKKVSNENIYAALDESEEDEEKSSSDGESQIDHETIQWITNYKESKTDRPLDVLLNDYSIWEMSKVERQRLHNHWRAKIHEGFVEMLSDLQKRHEEYRQEMNNIYDEGRRQVLLDSDVIGMTTNGAAKFQALIKSIGPRIIICEEAGEVLEAHILSALTQSTQHLILIGDHNQLRPHIATHSLSMDSRKGENYQLDKSLFERLVNGDKAVKIEKTQLLTQRRMRKEISDLIRYTLYSDLIDGENTAKYPSVRGAQRNVYFINHRHPEDSGGELAAKSHVNKYEVKMVVEMVKYFVRNGYTKPDDIAVLTPYLGQMGKIRDALAKSFVVVIDERDEQDIAEMQVGDDDDDDSDDDKNRNGGNLNISVASRKSLNQQVTLRTVDNFQGEEATIVIISLVRNFSKSGHDTIGFLSSSNRSNVLLSRAREGMYLIGNSELMESRSKDMWAPVIGILRKREQIGSGMPIVCNQHPNYKHNVTEPEQFAQLSPDGGCNEDCNKPLPCGHVCTYKCHSDDPEHIGVKCSKPCSKLHSECYHPCPKFCFQDCGECNFAIGNMTLPDCGHVLQNAKCWQNKTITTIKCKELVNRKLLQCEHTIYLHCFESIYNVKCREKCRKILECGHECLNECSDCQKYSTLHEIDMTIPIQRTQHGKCKNLCNRPLFCGHMCRKYCHVGSECPPCENECMVSCEHTSCKKICSEPCAVCAEECLWECEHRGRCEFSCGISCNRLPCNEKCDKKLVCGHKCAGVCGEICSSEGFCVICAPVKVQSQVSDTITNTTFGEVDWNEERMIILSCGHVYTMEIMDMHMEMEDYYGGSTKEGWTSIKMLPTLPTKPKTCPACRTPIKNIRRYGRIIKKYTLGLQNKKFLLKYNSQLEGITKQRISLENQMKDKRNQLKNDIIVYSTIPRDVVIKEHGFTNAEITPYYYFENITKYHGFDKTSKEVWIAHVEKLLKCYRELTSIIYATKESPHKKAFEAAALNLHQAKLAKDSEKNLIEKMSDLHISGASSQLTPQETFSQTGISIPQVDHRIYLDAFFEIINIQKVLLHEILFIIQENSKASMFMISDDDFMSIEEVWKIFAERLQLSIQKHLYKISEVAASAHYGRHLLLVSVDILEFDLKMLVYQLKYPPNGSILQARILGKCKGIDGNIRDLIESDGYKDAEEEIKNDINERLVKLIKICNEVKICAGNIGETLSVEEKLEIHRTIKIEFKSSDDWYECSNGHPYTIGIAMQMSRCPDCDAEIGGGSYQ